MLSKYLNNILQLLEGFNQSRVPLLIDIETKLVALGFNIHMVGVFQKIIKQPKRRSVAPKGRIWKNIKACFPRFKGFELDIYQCGTRYIYQKVYSFCIKFKEFKYKGKKADSPLSSNKARISALNEFLPILKSFVAWEVEKYRVEEHYSIWTVEENLMIYCEFRWRSWREQYDITR
jgi:hypothetical protein